MPNSNKDTIYIDVDDEITGIIDKVKTSGSKVVALVLPKRAAVFQSIVNMKLLKKAADSGKKNLVLITSEAGLMPLAGAAGIHVAKTLTSKPEMPLAPIAFSDSDDAFDEDEITPVPGEEVDPNKSVGELSGKEAAPLGAASGLETIALDNTEPDKEALAAADKTSSKDKAAKKDKKLKVPNFERFRKYLIIGAAVLILIILLFIFAGSTFAKATINIKTNASNVNANVSLNLSTQANSVDPSSGNIPAKQDSEQKTFSQQVGTTGQKNNGNKATGNIVMKTQECAPNLGQTPSMVPAGTGTSANSQTYITQQDATFNFTGFSGGNCANYQSSATPILAQNGGTSFNVSGVPFTVANRSDITASGSASGGTDNIVQVVNQSDINNAKSKISTNDSSVKNDLISQLKGQGYYAITATYNVGTPTVTTSNNVGEAASNVTVTENITYTMFGVHESDLKTLVDNNVDGQIDTAKQAILSEGLDKAIFNVNSLSANGGSISMSTVAEAGPHIDVNSVKKDSAGLKAGEIQSKINSYPGVTDVTVKISPFWSSNAPKNTSKINVKIAKPTTTVKSS